MLHYRWIVLLTNANIIPLFHYIFEVHLWFRYPSFPIVAHSISLTESGEGEIDE